MHLDLLSLLIHTFSILSLQLKKLRLHNESVIDLSNANPTRGHKEVRKSTSHIRVTTRYSDQQGSKSPQNPCQVQSPDNIGNLKYTGVETMSFSLSLCVCVYVCVVFPFILDVRLVDVPAGVTKEEGHTRFLIRLPSAAVLAFIFLARRIQVSLSLVDREKSEFGVLIITNY